MYIHVLVKSGPLLKIVMGSTEPDIFLTPSSVISSIYADARCPSVNSHTEKNVSAAYAPRSFSDEL